MIEHPVPQNITAYEFRLIGNMTIKQFLLLLLGGGLSFLIYSTNLPGFMKWPLIFFAAIGGVALAFVPYEERSLDQWLVNFLRAIYRPTKYYWRRIPKPPAFFSYEANQAALAAQQAPDLTPYRQTQVKEFLSTLREANQPAAIDPLDLLAQPSNVAALFQQVRAAADVTPGKPAAVRKPSLQTRPRPLGNKAGTVFTAPSTPIPGPTPAASSTPVVYTAPTPSITIEPESPAEEEVSAAPHQPKPARTTNLPTIAVTPKMPTTPAPTEAALVATPSTKTNTYLAVEKDGRGQDAGVVLTPVVFDPNLPFPSGANQPNLLIGMVHTADKGIIPNAIVEIVDADNNTVRAMKTNNLGQFYMSSPLSDGTYTIHTEKEGQPFPVYTFTAEGKILDPIDITAAG